MSYPVECQNERCNTFQATGRHRHIGDDRGAGGRWQCRKCGTWVERGPGESRRIAETVAYAGTTR